MDQSNRYADLSLDEDTLIAEGKHILVAYTMTPAKVMVTYQLLLTLQQSHLLGLMLKFRQLTTLLKI